MHPHYVVIGHPVGHSKSPQIHAAFALQTGRKLSYSRLEAPLDGLDETLAEFFCMGGAGCNITVPFKEQALSFANQLSERARRAGAVNTLTLADEGVIGDNTDGVGLLRDLARHTPLRGQRIMLIGAGGASRGALGPLLEAQPAQLLLVNRTLAKAQQLAQDFASLGPVQALEFAQLSEQRPQIIINASSASLAGQALPLPASLWQETELAYDMMYGSAPTAFLQQAAQGGSKACVDGLGMLVEQAAEAFWLWQGVRPDTLPVLAQLRAELSA